MNLALTHTLAGIWLPESGGGFAEGAWYDNVDWLSNFIIWVTVIFSLIIAGLMVYFSIKYRQTDKAKVAHGAHHSTALEIGWTLPPLVIVLFIFGVGFKGFLNMTEAPQGGNALEIRAQASKWAWSFYYPGGQISGREDRLDKDGNKVTFTGGLHVQDKNQAAYDYVLYVPSDRPVKITLESNDVLHGLFLPAMRIKKDVVPGRYNTLWFEPSDEGVSDGSPKEYPLYCTEYCGQGHSQMSGKIVVMSPNDYKKKMEELDIWNPKGLSPIELGKDIHARACASCHSVDGSAGTGPSWKGLYGQKNHAMIGGDSIEVDATYILESIRYPAAQKPAGYGAGAMSAFSEQQIPAGDVAAIIEYMKSINDGYDGAKLDAFPEGYEGEDTIGDLENVKAE